MTSTPDSILPENYDKWPRAIQRRYIEELYALYFPGRVQATAATPRPGDGDVVEAEIVE